MKYAQIYRNRCFWPVRLQCEVLGVSFTGYHQHHLRRQKIAHRRHLSDAACWFIFARFMPNFVAPTDGRGCGGSFAVVACG